MFDKTIRLSNGVKIPQLALGTWLIEDSAAEDAVRAAIEIGYTHIDTAQVYGNERGVGRGIRASGVGRRKLFVTSKVAAEIKDYETARASIEESLEKLGIGYIDLMLIHCPQPWSEYNKSPNRYFEGNLEVWRALTEEYQSGRLRAIGVSNFMKEDIENIWNNAIVKPVVNQVSCFVTHTPLGMIDYCREKGIVPEAYCPLGHGDILNNPDLVAIAARYGVTVAQLCIRYTVQLGAVTLPKSVHPEHIRSNAELDFVISDEDMETLKAMGQY